MTVQDSQGDRKYSADLEPGSVVVGELSYPPTPFVLLRRKTEAEVERWPGWWVLGGGGFADYVLDDEAGRYRLVGRLDVSARFALGLENTGDLQ